MYAAFLAELRSIAESNMEKRAVDPLTLGALGMASHIGSNLLVKATHGTQLARAARARLLAKGIQSGIAGKPQSALNRAGQILLGPEMFLTEHAGRRLGSELSTMGRGRQVRALKKLRKVVAISPQLQHAPVFEDVVGGINRTLENKLPKPGVPMNPSSLSQAAAYSAIPAAAITEPSSLVHMGINIARKGVAESGPGQEFMKNRLVQGLRGYAPGGRSMAAVDTLVSPAALNAQRIGAKVNEAVLSNPYTARRLAGATQTIVDPQFSRLRSAVGTYGHQLEALLTG